MSQLIEDGILLKSVVTRLDSIISQSFPDKIVSLISCITEDELLHTSHSSVISQSFPDGVM